VIDLSDNKDKVNDELKKLQKEIPQLEENADKNYHHELLKIWAKTIGLVLIGLLIGAILAWLFHDYLPVPYIAVDSSKFEETAKTIFTSTVTLSGLIIGFLPVVSFFFVREIKEEQQSIKREWNKQVEEYRDREESENKENNLNIINTYYVLLLMLYKNIRSGVLNYLKTYLLISLFLLFYLLMFFTEMILINLTVLFILIDTMFSVIILTGIVPIVWLALAEPTYRIVRYVVPEKIIKVIEPES